MINNMIVYRLEDKDGNGPFFYKNGQSKTWKDMKYDYEGLYVFRDPCDFLSDSYIDFLNNPDYILYEIIIKYPPIHQSCYSSEAIIYESSIISKKIFDKQQILCYNKEKRR